MSEITNRPGNVGDVLISNGETQVEWWEKTNNLRINRISGYAFYSRPPLYSDVLEQLYVETHTGRSKWVPVEVFYDDLTEFWD